MLGTQKRSGTSSIVQATGPPIHGVDHQYTDHPICKPCSGGIHRSVNIQPAERALVPANMTQYLPAKTSAQDDGLLDRPFMSYPERSSGWPPSTSKYYPTVS